MPAPDLLFRNIDVDPSADFCDWPTEAINTAIERGSLRHWSRIAAAIGRDPWGPVTRRVEEVLASTRPYGVAVGMDHHIVEARTRAVAEEKSQVSAELRSLLEDSQLSAAQFASRLGTSPSRLSTYLSGQVVPSATLIVRARRI